MIRFDWGFSRKETHADSLKTLECNLRREGQTGILMPLEMYDLQADTF